MVQPMGFYLYLESINSVRMMEIIGLKLQVPALVNLGKITMAVDEIGKYLSRPRILTFLGKSPRLEFSGRNCIVNSRMWIFRDILNFIIVVALPARISIQTLRN